MIFFTSARKAAAGFSRERIKETKPCLLKGAALFTVKRKIIFL
jgi:hypothetical protein